MMKLVSDGFFGGWLQGLAGSILLVNTLLLLGVVLAVAWLATRGRRMPFDIDRQILKLRRELGGSKKRNGELQPPAPLFFGREGEQDKFLEILRSPRPSARVLIVTGKGGIGKTELLKRFREICIEKQLPCGPIADLSKTVAVDELLTELANGREDFKSAISNQFEKELAAYRDLKMGRPTSAQATARLGSKVAEAADSLPLAAGAAAGGRAGAALVSAIADARAAGPDLETAPERMATALLE